MDLERNDQMVNILLAIFKQNHGLGMHMQALLDWPVYVIVRPSVNGF